MFLRWIFAPKYRANISIIERHQWLRYLAEVVVVELERNPFIALNRENYLAKSWLDPALKGASGIGSSEMETKHAMEKELPSQPRC